MLEKMSDFFEARLDGYDEHMLNNIESADEFYHYDTSLTVKHETEALLEAGFSSVAILDNWGATYTIKAVKQNNLYLPFRFAMKGEFVLKVSDNKESEKTWMAESGAISPQYLGCIK